MQAERAWRVGLAERTLAEWARHRQYRFGLRHDELPRKRRRRANLFAKAVAARHDRVQRCSPGPSRTRPPAQAMAVAATGHDIWMFGHAIVHGARTDAAQRPLMNDARGMQQPQPRACFLPMGSCSARIQGTLHRRAMLQRHMGGHTYHAMGPAIQGCCDTACQLLHGASNGACRPRLRVPLHPHA